MDPVEVEQEEANCDDAKAESAAFLTEGDDKVSTGFFKTFSPAILNNFIN
ncbi:MAG: hypothetical protein GY820_30405 [Gammaproteobacteria bacterium]|nr:hypothetical protein [Gammaproteobacteria bacterium]